MFVVSRGCEGDLRQSEIVLGAGQGGVQHKHIALSANKIRDGLIRLSEAHTKALGTGNVLRL